MTAPTAVSLFSGCGGSDIGLKKAGFEVLLSNDILPYAKEVYCHNMNDTEFICSNIEEIKTFPKADILVGCYPCQGFSQGGARQASRGINYLYREFDRVLRLLKPKAFIVENVSGMKRADFRHLLNNQLTRFRMAGYKVSYEVLDARRFGVPQERSRLFIVGIRSDFEIRFEFPFPTHSVFEWDKKESKKTKLPHCLTIRDAIGDLPLWPKGEFDEQPFHWYYLSRNRYRGWEQASKTIVAHSRHIPLHPLSPKLKRIHTDKWVFESNDEARRLSFREAARLQGFSKDFEFPDTAHLTMKYRVIGNAVPPALFKAVAEALPDIW